MNSLSAVDSQSWLGRRESCSEPVGLWRAGAMAASLNRPAPGTGTLLAPLWHWLYCVSTASQGSLGEDGHPQRGQGNDTLMPPVPQPLRMWAGGKLEMLRPIVLGGQLQRDSQVVNIRPTQGSHGEMVFVGLEHRYATEAGLAILEHQDIVYRHRPAAGYRPRTLAPLGIHAAKKRVLIPDERLLFRYSALSFNAHRVHYDLDYARRVEGYPGLLVQGPLLATVLMDLWCESQPREVIASLRSIRIRALAPAFVGQPLELCLGTATAGQQTLWAQRDDAAPLMQVDLEYPL